LAFLSFPNPSRQDPSNGVSAFGKAATYTQDNTNTEQTDTNIHASSGIRTHDLSVGAGEDSSWLRYRGHCVRLLIS
jgi:hypothetical protein